VWNFLSEETKAPPSISRLRIACILAICLNLLGAVSALVCLV